MDDFYDVGALVKLFNTPRDDEDSDSDCDPCENAIQKCDDDTPKKIEVSPYTKIESAKKERGDTNDNDMENVDALSDTACSDWKKIPKWTITYRQNLSSSDVFLQMGTKSPATASCEYMIVTVNLPGENMQNMDIKVHPNKLEVYSPNFSLKIPLPHTVHPQKGDAKWEKEHEKLTITLNMEREFDFINF